ncbi:MAG: integrase, partial [Myxococcota bacterium]
GWTEQCALWSKGDMEVVKQMRCIESMLPFPLRGFDSDNGSEFINHRLLKHFIDRKVPVQFTRSRAYKKNDNAHVEQKNWTHVRQWLGYERIDVREAVELLNQLYTAEWRLFHNYYCPSMKLISKERQGSKTIKKHDNPQTPYQRILESDQISDYTKRNLTHVFENTNPLILKEKIKKKLRQVFKLCYNSRAEHN